MPPELVQDWGWIGAIAVPSGLLIWNQVKGWIRRETKSAGDLARALNELAIAKAQLESFSARETASIERQAEMRTKIEQLEGYTERHQQLHDAFIELKASNGAEHRAVKTALEKLERLVTQLQAQVRNLLPVQANQAFELPPAAGSAGG